MKIFRVFVLKNYFKQYYLFSSTSIHRSNSFSLCNRICFSVPHRQRERCQVEKNIPSFIYDLIQPILDWKIETFRFVVPQATQRVNLMLFTILFGCRFILVCSFQSSCFPFHFDSFCCCCCFLIVTRTKTWYIWNYQRGILFLLHLWLIRMLSFYQMSSKKYLDFKGSRCHQLNIFA